MAVLSSNSVSISIEFLHSALTKLALPVDEIDRLLMECRIAPSLLRSPQARLSLGQFARIMTELTRRSGDELLGHGLQPVPLGTLPVLLHWLLPAENLEHALKRACHFYQILGKGFALDLTEGEDDIQVSLALDGLVPASRVYISEYGFFFIHRILSWLIKEILPIGKLQFPFAAPGHARDYRLMFYGAPVAFNASTASLCLPRAVLQREVVQRQDSLNGLLRDPVSQLLMLNFTSDSWSARVAECVQQQLQHLPTLPQLASQLDIAPHTLQRRLAAEGSSYLAIKNQIKRDSAIELLVNSRLSIETISARLGFSETSPFTRTFKEWTGVPPSAYRKHQ